MTSWAPESINPLLRKQTYAYALFMTEQDAIERYKMRTANHIHVWNTTMFECNMLKMYNCGYMYIAIIKMFTLSTIPLLYSITYPYGVFLVIQLLFF